MEMTNEQFEASAEPTTGPTGESVPALEGDGGETASDFYDADRPPFEERPEKPKPPPAPAGPQAPPAGALGSRELQVRAGSAVVVALLALLLLRRRRRSHGHLSRRARRALSR